MQLNTIIFSPFILAAVLAVPTSDSKPLTYGALMRKDATIRNAILKRAPIIAQGEVWKGRFEAYKASHQNLTSDQETVIDDAIAMVGSGDVSTYQDLKEAAINAFGFDEARVIFTKLDDEGDTTSKKPNPLNKRQNSSL